MLQVYKGTTIRTAKFIRRLLAVIIAVALVLSGMPLRPPEVRAEETTITWVGSSEGDGYWHTAGNWSPEQVPGNGDSVVISAESTVVECVYGATGVTLECAGNLILSDEALLSLTGASTLTGGSICGNGTVEISGEDSKLTWSGGSIGSNENTGRLIVGEGAQFSVQKTAGQAVLNLAVENNGHVSIANGQQVFMMQGYTQTNAATLTCEIAGDETFIPISVKQKKILSLGGKLHVNLVDGYMPNNGKELNVIVYPTSVTRTGRFAEVISSEISRRFTASYDVINPGIVLTANVITTAIPVPWPEPGTYGGGTVNVTLSSETEGATIYYTKDGVTAPTTESTLYSGPIVVNADMTIKAIAVAEGLLDSSVVTLDYEIKNDFAGGDGTEENPYLVSTADELDKVRDYPYAYFKQTANIDLDVEPYNTSEGWSPIGGYDYTEEEYYPFCGIFDGQEYTISNLFIHQIAESEEDPSGEVGLFGSVEEAQIRNVKLLNVDVSGDSYVGGLVGYAWNSLIENCSSTSGNVHGTGYCIGGLVGESELSQITGSYTRGCAISGEDDVGGLVGLSNSVSQITGSYSTCTVSGKTEVGGLIGLNHGQIYNSFALGDVTGTGMSIGGLAGMNNLQFAKIENAYAMGKVQGVSQVGGLVGYSSGTINCAYAMGKVTGTSVCGGLVGEAGAEASNTNSYWDKGTSCQTGSAGGTGKSTAEMKNPDTYAGWNFTDIWGIDAGKNDGYPFLRGVTVEESAAPNTEADITAFSFVQQTGEAIINSVAGTIAVEVAHGTNVTNLVAIFTLSSGASAMVNGAVQVSGTTANNFRNPAVYTVTAEDGSTTKDWTVTVTVKVPPQDNGEPFWQCRSPKPTPYSLSEVKYVNSKFIAVGNNGTILSSIDGENWDSLDLGSKDRLQGIAYGNGKYVAVGYYTESESVAHGVIYESSDGETWHKVLTLSNQKLMDIVFGGGRFAAVGHGDKIITSGDGLTWETKAVGDVSIYLNSITYANSVYVAVGGYYGQGHIVTSTDGENWSKQTSVSDALEDVTFGNGKFVAVTASSVSPGIYTSMNYGENWKKKTASAPLFTVDYDGNRFIAAGNDSWSASSYVFTSTDGTTWTGGNVPIGAIFWAVASGGGKYVGVGGIGNIVISADGTNWAWVTSGTVNDLLDVAYNGSIFVSVGEKGTLQTSPDGITWTVRDSGTTEYLRSVEYLNGKFVAVGNKGVILTSDDGIRWTKQTSGRNTALYDVTYGDGLYVVVGGVDNDVIILTSPDGATWTPATHNCKVYFTTVAYGSGTFIALTHNGGVFTSSDGVAWSSTTSLPGRARDAEDIIYADGRFVGTGGYGEIYISDDNGVTWTVKEKIFGEHYIYSVAYDGGNLVAVTQDGKILISFDKGDTWEQQISGFENQRYLFGVVAGSSNFVAVGSVGLTLQSKDFGTPGNPDADAVAADKTALTWNSIKGGNITQDNVTANLVNPLPTSGASGTTISWSVTLDAGWIDTGTGVVTRPTSVQGDQTVTLTATITKGSASDSKSFTLTIKATAPEQTADEAIALDLAALTWNVIKGSNSYQTNLTANLILPARGANGTTISWSVSPDDGSINTTTGKVTRPASGQSNAQVTLTATISKEGGTDKTKGFSLTIPALPGGDSGSGSGGSGVTTYTITATAGTGGKISPEGDISVKKGNQKNFTIKAKDGYVILDVEIDGKSIGPVDTYTFKDVNKNHTIKAIFERRPETGAEIEIWDNPFIDVSEQDWFYENIRKIWGKGLMKGTASDKFSPGLNATRAMIVTILYRLESEPKAAGVTSFSDVSPDTWYTDAVIWATRNNITTGYGSGEFGSDDSITREQLAALLYRYSQYKGFDTGITVDLSAFTDGDQVSSWANSAVKWAVGSGIITGKLGGVLDPKGKATRAEIATMLSRYIEMNNLL